MPRNKRKNAAKRNMNRNANPPRNVRVLSALTGPVIRKPPIANLDTGAQAEVPSKIVRETFQQLLDPCYSKVATIPDKWHGSNQYVTSTTYVSMGASSAGSASGGGRFAIISPFPTKLVALSGTSTFDTAATTNDALYSSFSNSWKYLRVAGLCVTVTKSTAYDTPDGNALIGCFTASEDENGTFIPADMPACLALMERSHCTPVSITDGVEIAWCPESEGDFTPYAPAANGFNADNDIAGRWLSRRPSICFYFNGATSAVVNLTVTVRYEGMMLPGLTALGSEHRLQSSTAMDLIFSALPSVCWIKRGGTIARSAAYASKVASFLGRAGWAAIIDGSIKKISC